MAEIITDEKPFSLADAAPVTEEDLPDSEKLTENDLDAISEFEELWNEFLTKNPEILPTGKKGIRMETLQTRIEATRVSKVNVEAELKKQLEFLQSSKSTMEEQFEDAIKDASAGRDVVANHKNKILEQIRTSSLFAESINSWNLFDEVLEEAAVQSGIKTLPSDADTVNSTRGSNVIKPSPKAMYLTNAAEQENCRSMDYLMRAYKIDNALLQAKLKTLERENEKAEMMSDTLETVGKFLTEQNIWGLLTNRSSNATASGVSVAGTNPSMLRSRVPLGGMSTAGFTKNSI